MQAINFANALKKWFEVAPKVHEELLAEMMASLKS
jgi:hypothetical protein